MVPSPRVVGIDIAELYCATLVDRQCSVNTHIPLWIGTTSDRVAGEASVKVSN